MSNETELKNTNTLQEENVKAVGHNMMVYKNNLLGYFNVNNIYIINPEIVEDLLESDKQIAGRNGNTILLSSYHYGVGNISFEMEVNEENGNGTAVLYIVEPISRVNGLVTQNLRTKIAVYENKLDNDFYKKVIYSFKITDDSAQMEQPNIEEACSSYIYNRKKFNERMLLDEQSSFNNVFKDLFDTQYKYLSNNDSNFCKEVKKKFDERKSKIEKQYLNIGKKVDYFAMYELLILCIDEIVEKNPKYNKDEAEFYKQTLPAIKFALEQLRKIGARFKENQIKQIQKMNPESLTKEVQAFLKILQNGDKIKNDNNLWYSNFYTFGLISNNDGVELNGLKQFLLHKNGNMGDLMTDKINEVRSFFDDRIIKNSEIIDDLQKNLISHFDSTKNILDEMVKKIGAQQQIDINEIKGKFDALYNENQIDLKKLLSSDEIKAVLNGDFNEYHRGIVRDETQEFDKVEFDKNIVSRDPQITVEETSINDIDEPVND